MENGYRLLPRFLTTEETAHWRDLIESRQDLFQQVAPKAGMNLPYSVLDGNAIRTHLAELAELATTRLQEITQTHVDVPIAPMRDPKRAYRIQYYRARGEGFRWHLDGGAYSALLTLRNTNRGATEIIPPSLSRWLKPIPYLLFPFPGVLELARPRPIVADAGDLLILHGGAAIHRGTTELATGERMVLVATFDPVDKKSNPVWTWVARRLNY